jgi:hypothetical protein
LGVIGIVPWFFEEEWLEDILSHGPLDNGGHGNIFSIDLGIFSEQEGLSEVTILINVAFASLLLELVHVDLLH